MKEVLLYFWSRRTTVLGYVGIVLGILVTSNDLFSIHTIKWFVLLNSIVTAVLGHYNHYRLKQQQEEQ